MLSCVSLFVVNLIRALLFPPESHRSVKKGGIDVQQLDGGLRQGERSEIRMFRML